MSELRDQKLELFAQHYAANRNASAAARHAGSKAEPASLAGCGYSLLGTPGVKERITELSQRLLEVTDMSARRLTLELGRTAHMDHRRFYRADGSQKAPHELDDDEAACVKGYDRNGRYQFWSKDSAQQILAKHFKLIGDEGDGVSALASALAERLNKARARLEGSDESTPEPERLD